MSVIIRDAQTAYSCLNGVFCIYKGRKMPYNSLTKLIKHRLAAGNVTSFECRILNNSEFPRQQHSSQS